MQPDLELVLFWADAGLRFEGLSKTGVADFQFARKTFYADPFVITPSQEPQGLLDFLLHRARRVRVPSCRPQNDGQKMQAHRRN